MVCQLRPLVYSLGLNNPLRICLTPRKLHVKNLWRNKQGNWQCKMAGAGIRSFAKFHAADSQVPSSGCHGHVKPVAIRSQIHISVCGNPCNGYSILGNPRCKRRKLPQSAAHNWEQNLARDWIPAPAILHRDSACLKRDIFLLRNF
jgi:hypothetical protein